MTASWPFIIPYKCQTLYPHNVFQVCIFLILPFHFIFQSNLCCLLLSPSLHIIIWVYLAFIYHVCLHLMEWTSHSLWQNPLILSALTRYKSCSSMQWILLFRLSVSYAVILCSLPQHHDHHSWTFEMSDATFREKFFYQMFLSYYIIYVGKL